jgi:SAM-dependent methyltransferase
MKEQPTDLGVSARRFKGGTARFSHEELSNEKETTLCMYPSLIKSLNVLKGLRFDRFLDLGCGRGALPMIIADQLSIPEVYGVDINRARLEVAKGRLPVVRLDLEDGLPFGDGIFDLVTIFGVFEHMKFFDNPIAEAHRVLKDDGLFLVCLPNLGSYVNRIQFLFGYQPRSVEISRLTVAGVARRFYEKDIAPISHIHSATLRGLTELLEFHGFRVINVIGGSPRLKGSSDRLLVRFLDFLTSKRPSLSRRIFVIARKVTRPSP